MGAGSTDGATSSAGRVRASLAGGEPATDAGQGAGGTGGGSMRDEGTHRTIVTRRAVLRGLLGATATAVLAACGGTAATQTAPATTAPPAPTTAPAAAATATSAPSTAPVP